MGVLRVLCLALVAAGCLYDADARCSPGQVQDERGYCVAATPPPVAGAACDTAGQPCADPRYPHCQVTAGTAGYCTQTGCARSSDCPAGYACQATASPPYCKRPPVGQARPCSGHDDCSGTEATFCDTMFLRQCLVEGCQTNPNSCHEGWTCCDFSAQGLDKTLCVPLPTCPRL